MSARFRPRPVIFLRLWEHAGWRLKVYGISEEHRQPRPELVQAAERAAAERLPAPSDGNYGVGFLSIHEGREANYVFLDWWANENELQHHVYRSPAEAPGELEYVSGVAGNVWDLQIVWFERNAWVEKVLSNPRGPDVDAYLKRRLSDQA